MEISRIDLKIEKFRIKLIKEISRINAIYWKIQGITDYKRSRKKLI